MGITTPLLVFHTPGVAGNIFIQSGPYHIHIHITVLLLTTLIIFIDLFTVSQWYSLRLLMHILLCNLFAAFRLRFFSNECFLL